MPVGSVVLVGFAVVAAFNLHVVVAVCAHLHFVVDLNLHVVGFCSCCSC